MRRVLRTFGIFFLRVFDYTFDHVDDSKEKSRKYLLRDKIRFFLYYRDHKKNYIIMIKRFFLIILDIKCLNN